MRRLSWMMEDGSVRASASVTRTQPFITSGTWVRSSRFRGCMSEEETIQSRKKHPFIAVSYSRCDYGSSPNPTHAVTMEVRRTMCHYLL